MGKKDQEENQEASKPIKTQISDTQVLLDFMRFLG